MTDPYLLPSDAERIRFVLGATGTLETLVSEEEIAFALAEYPSDWRLAAAYMATNLANKALNDPDSFTLTGTMSISWPDRAAAWRSIAWNLRQEAAQYAKQNAAPVTIQRSQMRRQPLDPDTHEYTRRRRVRYDRPFSRR